MDDITIYNKPEEQRIRILLGSKYSVTIKREDDGKVWVVVDDDLDGSRTTMILGEPGETLTPTGSE